MEPGDFFMRGGIVNLIPVPIYPNVNKIRKTLYRGVNPAGYRHIPKRLWDAFNGKQANKSIFRDDQWATYLQIPEEERRSDKEIRKIKPAIYRPTKGDVGEAVYKLSLDAEDKQALIDDAIFFNNPGENKVSRVLDKYLGDHTVGRGRDSKGEYVSYYDRYDLNPVAGGTPIRTGIRSFDKWISGATSDMDLSLGIGKPFELYDRIYLDDYYGVPKEDRGGYYLPEVIVKPIKNDKK